MTVIDTATNTLIGSPIGVGNSPLGIAVNPAGTRVYVANAGSGTVSVIDAATNTVVGAPISVGSLPFSFGLFLGGAAAPPPPPVAATPIPTVSGWSLLMLAGLLSVLAIGAVRRRR